jgi:hypothetical protein
MRRRLVLFVALAWAPIGACSFVSTDGLTGGSSDASALDASPAPDANDDSSVDVTPDGPDAARDPRLIAEYAFEDPDGAVALDTSGNGKHGNLIGASFTAAGKRGRALEVHGADFLDVPGLTGGNLFPSSGTFSVWCRYTFPPNDVGDRGVLDAHDGSRAHLFLRHAGSGTPGTLQAAFQLGDGSGQYTFVSTFPAPQNTWIHVVMTWDDQASIGAVYVGGVLVVQLPYSTKPYVPDGQIFHLGQGFIGAIDEVKVFNRSLPANEATALE